MTRILQGRRVETGPAPITTLSGSGVGYLARSNGRAGKAFQHSDLPERCTILQRGRERNAESSTRPPVALDQGLRADDSRGFHAARAGEDFCSDKEAGKVFGELIRRELAEQAKSAGHEGGMQEIAGALQRGRGVDAEREAGGIGRID